MFKLIPSFKGMYSISEQGVVRREYDKRNNLDRGFPGKIMSIVYTSLLSIQDLLFSYQMVVKNFV